MDIDVRVNLPDAVRSRLAACGLDVASGRTIGGLVARVRPGGLRIEEERFAPAAHEQRARVVDTDERFGVHGYASVVEVAYPVAGGPPWGWDEIIDRHAFDRALRERDDVRFLINHGDDGGLALARTTAGTLTLEADDIGLRMEAPDLDLANPKVQEVRSAVRRGDADQMSFAFRAMRQEWNEDYTVRRILEVRLFDVAVVTYPANEAATIAELNARTAPPARRMSLRLARELVAAGRL